jgi:hypothetical protein
MSRSQSNCYNATVTATATATAASQSVSERLSVHHHRMQQSDSESFSDPLASQLNDPKIGNNSNNDHHCDNNSDHHIVNNRYDRHIVNNRYDRHIVNNDRLNDNDNDDDFVSSISSSSVNRIASTSKSVVVHQFSSARLQLSSNWYVVAATPESRKARCARPVLGTYGSVFSRTISFITTKRLYEYVPSVILILAALVWLLDIDWGLSTYIIMYSIVALVIITEFSTRFDYALFVRVWSSFETWFLALNAIINTMAGILAAYHREFDISDQQRDKLLYFAYLVLPSGFFAILSFDAGILTSLRLRRVTLTIMSAIGIYVVLLDRFWRDRINPKQRCIDQFCTTYPELYISTWIALLAFLIKYLLSSIFFPRRLLIVGEELFVYAAINSEQMQLSPMLEMGYDQEDVEQVRDAIDELHAEAASGEQKRVIRAEDDHANAIEFHQQEQVADNHDDNHDDDQTNRRQCHTIEMNELKSTDNHGDDHDDDDNDNNDASAPGPVPPMRRVRTMFGDPSASAHLPRQMTLQRNNHANESQPTATVREYTKMRWSVFHHQPVIDWLPLRQAVHTYWYVSTVAALVLFVLAQAVLHFVTEPIVLWGISGLAVVFLICEMARADRTLVKLVMRSFEFWFSFAQLIMYVGLSMYAIQTGEGDFDPDDSVEGMVASLPTYTWLFACSTWMLIVDSMLTTRGWIRSTGLWIIALNSIRLIAEASFDPWQTKPTEFCYGFVCTDTRGQRLGALVTYAIFSTQFAIQSVFAQNSTILISFPVRVQLEMTTSSGL